MLNSLLGGSKPKEDEKVKELTAANGKLQERVGELERKCGRYGRGGCNWQRAGPEF